MSAPRQPHVCMVAYTEYDTDARVRREAETLAANGFDVRCLCLTRDRRTPYRLEGVHVTPLAVRKYRGKSTGAYVASYLRFLLLAGGTCLTLLARGELDVVHVHNIPDFLVAAALIPRLAGRKVVLDVHDSVPETFATKFSQRAAVWKLLCLEERLSARVAHRVICVNHPQRDRLVARGIPGKKVFVSMNVPDPAIFGNGNGHRRPAASAGDGVNLVYHGTMAERLGVDLVIRAVAMVRPRVPDVRLHLWGSGDDLPAFQQLAASLGVTDRVLFRPEGYALRELPERLSRMHIGVVGNRHTPAGELMLPVKLLEYVSLGIPAIAPRLPTIRRYFDEDMVTYFEPGSVSALADSIHRLASQPALRAAQAARAISFLAEYGWHQQGADFVRFYRRLVES